MLSKINLKFLVLGVLFAQSTFAEKAKIHTVCKKPGQVALTFDDGPRIATTPKALETLKKYNIKGTFFINYQNWDTLDMKEAVDIVKREYQEGHDIGSHTYEHKDLFVALDDGTFKHNIDDMSDKIKSIIGVTPVYFRPPNGDGGYEEFLEDRIKKNNEVQEYLGNKGNHIIMWGADTNDWQHKEKVDKVIESLNTNFKAPGVSPKTHSFIVLLHDVHETTVNILLPTVIEYINSLGYEFVPLSECIGVQPYISASGQEVGNPNRDGGKPSGFSGYNESVKPDTPGNLNVNNTTTDTNNTDNKKGTSDATTLHYSLFLTVLAFIYSLIF